MKSVTTRLIYLYFLLFSRLMYVFFLLACILAGLIFWLIENAQFRETPFAQSIVSSIWWAFVTMTTVGYGDVTPKTNMGRLFATGWMYCALIVCATITGLVSTFVFDHSLFDMSGCKIAVLQSSYEG